MTQESDLFTQLVTQKPFNPDGDRGQTFLAAVNESYRHHFKSCKAYQRFCRRRGLDEAHKFTCLEDVPFLPVQAFKENADLLSSVPASEIKIRLSSSATSGKPSTVVIDKKTSKRQIKALAAVMSAVLGRQRRPFIVFDADPHKVGAGSLGARNAAVRGFLNLAREVRYVMDLDANGKPVLNEGLFEQALREFVGEGEPFCVFGFTYVLYNYGIKPLFDKGKQFQLAEGSKVIHIGGWKKLKDQKISKGVFNAELSELFRIEPTAIVDFYGFTEQMGVTYPDGPSGSKCVPAFSELIVRDPVTFQPVPDGQEGLLEFITPLPYSYPGLAILTDDLGVIRSRGDGEKGWRCTEFEILGRAEKAEPRGCGDIMGDKIDASLPAIQRSRPKEFTQPQARLLFDHDKNRCPKNIFDPVAIEELPLVENLAELADELKQCRNVLDYYTIDELICLIDRAAQLWMLPDSHLAPLRTQGLQFLSGWCRARSLRSIADQSLRGMRGFLDGPRSLDGTNKRMMFARPRGLVSHWLAGNVPLLGMLALAQSILTRNANLIKVASSFSSVLPALLETFRDLEMVGPRGRILRGKDILKSIAIVYYPRVDQASAAAMSENADVRIAWGGRDAIENTINLPRCYSTEDIIFGPKLSYMVIGREMLETERMVRRYSRRAATDASVFDQYACASPHTIFVESGGAASGPREFAERLASEMDKALIRIPKGLVDLETAAQIESIRLRYEFIGDLWKAANADWTVLYDEYSGQGLADPCYSRVITVRAIDDIMHAAEFAHSGIQTVGLAMSGERKVRFSQRAAEMGAERFPDVGRMTFFDTPWDGIFPMDRLVKWATIGGPF